METVSHDGRVTAYAAVETDTKQKQLLYVHGSGATHAAWSRQYQHRRGRVPAAGLDLSGHGRSEDLSLSDETVLAAYAADVVAVARQVDADVLIGHSLGGAVVLHLLLEELYDPAGVVLVGTGAKLAVAEPLRTALATEFETAVEWLHERDRLFHDPDPGAVEQSKAAVREVGQAVTRRDFQTAHSFDVRGQLAAVDLEVPALAASGAHDSLTPPRYHEYLATALPACEHASIADAAHLVMLEQPVAFHAAVDAFLERLS